MNRTAGLRFAALILAASMLAALLLAACGATPTQPPPASLAKTPVPASTAPASSTAGEDANPAMTAQKASATAGYRRVVRNGRELYCREDVVLGSKISRGEVCRTSAELENAQRNTDDFMRGVRSTAGESAPPTGPLGR